MVEANVSGSLYSGKTVVLFLPSNGSTILNSFFLVTIAVTYFLLRYFRFTFNDSLFHSFTTFLIQIKVNSKSSPQPNGLMFTSNFLECQNIISDPVIHGSLNNIHFIVFFSFSKKLPIVVCPSVCGNNFFSRYFDI